jgi:hypothetical protein
MDDIFYIPGTKCTVNKNGDLFLDSAIRPFFNKDCVIVKRTKSGLIQVALSSNKKCMCSVPARNIDLISYQF